MAQEKARAKARARARLVGLGCVQRTATQDAKLRLCED